MRKLTLTMIMMFIGLTAFSQFGIKGGGAFGVVTNTKNTNPAYGGFYAGATYNITDDLRVEALLEGMFRSKNSVTSTFLPVTFGADYSFLSGMVRPFVGFNLGSYTISSKTKFAGSNQNFSVSGTQFGLFPKVGVNIALTDNLLLDITTKYHVIFAKGNNSGTTQLFGLNLGVNYVF